MADGDTGVVDPQQVQPDQPDTLTPDEQEKFNRLLAKRLEREKATSERERQKAIEEALKAERDKVAMERMTADEKAEALHRQEMDKLTKERDAQAKALAEARRELALSKAQAKMASMGLPPELAANVLGEDDDATDANIATLSKTVNDLVSRRVGESLSHGAPRAGGSKVPDAVEAALDKAMGITR